MLKYNICKGIKCLESTGKVYCDTIYDDEETYNNNENSFCDENDIIDIEWDYLKRNCNRKPFDDLLIFEGGIEL